MAGDKKKNNKFIKIIAGLLFVAIVVGGILLFIPSDKTSLVGQLSEARECMLLQDKQSRDEYKIFKERVEGNDRVQVYVDEINAVQTIADDIEYTINYYNYYIKFATSNRTYKNNNGKAISSLQKAIAKSKELNSIISNEVKLSISGETSLKSTWIKYRGEFSNYITYCKTALEALSNILCGCYGETITINDGTKTNVKAINDYLSVIGERVAETVENDKVASSSSSFSLTYGGIVNKFNSFVAKVIISFGSEQNYYFDSSVQQKYQEVIAFLENNTFKDVIKTIDGNGNFAGEDKSAELLAVEKYLGGN